MAKLDPAKNPVNQLLVKMINSNQELQNKFRSLPVEEREPFLKSILDIWKRHHTEQSQLEQALKKLTL